MQFMGYRRPDGRVGVRNHVLVLPTVVCALRVCELIAAAVPGVVCAYHQQGCGSLGEDREQTLRTLVGLGRNPNVAAVLVVGLGCESVTVEEVIKGISSTGKPIASLVIQAEGTTAAAVARGIPIAQEMVKAATRQQREPFSVDNLVIGTECGSSDTTSGLAANPALGAAMDIMNDKEATIILSETTEFIGAEHILARRASTPEISRQILRLVERVEREVMRVGVDLRGSQPTPGNIAGGLTTIEEKSLGCIYKGGTRPIVEVVEYAQEPSRSGLVIMDTPGYDVESVTGMVAGGAQIIVFTTGRGTPTGNPISPVIKLTANPMTWKYMADNIDIYVGGIIEGTANIGEMAELIVNEILEVASGKLTRAEILGHRELAICRKGYSV